MHVRGLHVYGRVCVEALRLLYVPVDLTVDLCLGVAPPKSAYPSLKGENSFFYKLHEECLVITGRFLLAIDRMIHL